MLSNLKICLGRSPLLNCSDIGIVANSSFLMSYFDLLSLLVVGYCFVEWVMMSALVLNSLSLALHAYT